MLSWPQAPSIICESLACVAVNKRGNCFRLGMRRSRKTSHNTDLINIFCSFGSRIISESTGILLNDGMDDFSRPGFVNKYRLPGSPANYIAPGKIPLSSMAPTILLDGDGDVRLLIGAAGGSKITSSIAYVIKFHSNTLETNAEIDTLFPLPLLCRLCSDTCISTRRFEKQ